MEDGRPLGEAHVDLDSCEDVDKALKHHKEYLGERFVNIEALEVAGHSVPECGFEVLK